MVEEKINMILLVMANEQRHGHFENCGLRSWIVFLKCIANTTAHVCLLERTSQRVTIPCVMCMFCVQCALYESHSLTIECK